jgi:hypothetical protein
MEAVMPPSNRFVLAALSRLEARHPPHNSSDVALLTDDELAAELAYIHAAIRAHPDTPASVRADLDTAQALPWGESDWTDEQLMTTRGLASHRRSVA